MAKAKRARKASATIGRARTFCPCAREQRQRPLPLGCTCACCRRPNRRNSTQAEPKRQKDDGLRNPQPKRSGTTRTRDRSGLCRTPRSGNGARDRAGRIIQRVRRMARSNLTWRADKSPLIPRDFTSADARQPKKRPGRLRQQSVTTVGRQKGETTSLPCQSPMTNGTRQRGCGREVHTTTWLHPLSPKPTV